MHRSAAPGPSKGDDRAVVPEPADPGPSTLLTLGEMVALTGVGAERLRTWERRHGFPRTVRAPNGARRFEPDDVARVIAVSHALAAGLRLGDAIRQVADGTPPGPPADGLTSGAERMLAAVPRPALVVAADHGLPVRWCNGAVRAATGRQASGEQLLALLPGFAGSPGHAALLEVLNGQRRSAVLEHDAWSSPIRRPARSWAWEVAGRGAAPCAVMVELPDTGAALGAGQRRDSAGAWAAAVHDAREALHAVPEPSALRASIGALTQRIGAVDGILATYAVGTMLAARSVRGAIAPHALELEPGDPADRALRERAIDWLGSEDRRRLGVAPRLQTVMLPVCARQEPIGAIFLVFREELALDDVTRELLLSYASGIGLAMLCSRRPGR